MTQWQARPDRRTIAAWTARGRLGRRLRALAIVALVCAAAPVAAQDVVITGRVLGPDRQPVPDQDVLLHRVTDQGGARLSQATTDMQGRFSLRAENAGAGVFFVATRYQGQLYIGPMLRPPFPDDSAYVVQVGIPGVGDVASMMGGAQPGPAVDRGTAEVAATTPRTMSRTRGVTFGILLLTLSIGTGVYFAVQGTGPSRRRRALIRIAELDEQLQGSADAGARAGARSRLLRRVAEPSP